MKFATMVVIALAISLPISSVICKEKTPSTGKPTSVSARDPEMLAALKQFHRIPPELLGV